MFGKKKTDNSPIVEDEYDDEAEELSLLKMAAKRMNVWRILLILAIVSSFWALLAVVSNSGLVNDNNRLMQQAISQTSNEVPGKQVALNSVVSWLSGGDTPFPQGTSNLTWDRGRKVREVAGKGEKKTTDVYYVHYFSFIDTAAKTTRRVAQTVKVENDMITATGTPSILSDNSVSLSDSSTTAPDGYKTVDNSSVLSPLVESWGRAYTGSDSKAFTVLIGDSDNTHVYRPANLGKLASSTVNWAVYVNKDGSATQGTSDLAVLSVTLQFTPKQYKKTDDIGTADNSANSSSQNSTVKQATTTVSVLVQNPNSGAARIVAWGAEGDFMGLKPFSQFVLSDSNSQASSSGSDSNSDSGNSDSDGSSSDDSGQDSQQ